MICSLWRGHAFTYLDIKSHQRSITTWCDSVVILSRPRIAGKQRASLKQWVTVPCHDFLFPQCWNSQRGICLWVDAILNQGSGRGGWWWNNSKRNQWAQSGVLKASPNKQCWLVSGRHCYVDPDAQTQTARRIVVSRPGVLLHPAILHESQQPRSARKLSERCKAAASWQMGPSVSPAGGSNLDGTTPGFLEGFVSSAATSLSQPEL